MERPRTCDPRASATREEQPNGVTSSRIQILVLLWRRQDRTNIEGQLQDQESTFTKPKTTGVGESRAKKMVQQRNSNENPYPINQLQPSTCYGDQSSWCSGGLKKMNDPLAKRHVEHPKTLKSDINLVDLTRGLPAPSNTSTTDPS